MHVFLVLLENIIKKQSWRSSLHFIHFHENNMKNNNTNTIFIAKHHFQTSFITSTGSDYDGFRCETNTKHPNFRRPHRLPSWNPEPPPEKKAQPPAAHPGSQGRPFASCWPDWGNNLHDGKSSFFLGPYPTFWLSTNFPFIASNVTVCSCSHLVMVGCIAEFQLCLGAEKPRRAKIRWKHLVYFLVLSWLGGWRIVASSTSSMVEERNEPTCLLAGHLEASSPITSSFVLRLYKWDRMIERNCRLIQVYRALNM